MSFDVRADDVMQACQAALREYPRLMRYRSRPSRRVRILRLVVSFLLGASMAGAAVHFARGAWGVPGWLPLVPFWLGIVATRRALRHRVMRRRMERMVPVLWSDLGGSPVPSVAGLDAGSIWFRSAAVDCRWQKATVHAILDLPDHLVLVAHASSFPIPKRAVDTRSLTRFLEMARALGFPTPTVPRRPVLTPRAWALSALLCFVLIVPIGRLTASWRGPGLAGAAPPIPMHVADLVIGLPDGAMSLTQMEFVLDTVRGRPHARLRGVIKASNVGGVVATETYWTGFTPLAPEDDFRWPGSIVPPNATRDRLLEDGAIASWKRETGGQTSTCVAARTYFDRIATPIGAPLYRRNTYLTACSSSRTDGQMRSWAMAAAPALAGATARPLDSASLDVRLAEADRQ